MTEKPNQQLIDELEEFSKTVTVNGMGNTVTYDFRLDVRPLRQAPSTLVQQGGKIKSATIRLPAKLKSTEHLDRRSEVKDLARLAGLSGSCLVYCREQTGKPHIKLYSRHIDEEEFTDRLSELTDILEEY